jgi:hypothetical protein
VIAAVVVCTACSGGGSSSDGKAKTAGAGTTTTSSAGSGSDTTTTTGASTGGGTTADGVDLTATPAMFSVNSVGNAYALYLYGNLSQKAVITPLEATVPTNSSIPVPYRLSPDQRFIAVALDGDAVRKPRLQILATDTGKAVLTSEVDVDKLYVDSWSPDSTAVMARSTSQAAVYHLDGRIEQLGYKYVGWWATGTKGVVFVPSQQLSITSQLVDSKHATVLLRDVRAANPTSDVPTVATRLDFATGKQTLLGGNYSLGGHLWDPGKCGRFALLGRWTPGRPPGSSSVDRAIYDADSGKLVPVHMPTTDEGCPLASNGGGKAAFVSNTGVGVVDLTSGKEATIARTGRPLAWSKDDTHVLVVGDDGTFLVAADGSGGKKASTQLGRYCPLDHTGKVLYATGANQGLEKEKIFLYDLATDSATQIGTGRFSSIESCEVSADEKWAVTGSLVVDIANGHATTWAPLDANGRSFPLTVHLRDVPFSVRQDGVS